jgi:3-dehydroquinate dehydratase-1
VRRGLALGADIVKIACKVDSPDAYPRLLDTLSLAPKGRLAVLGMGPYGVALRVFLPAAGSALAFAYLDAPTAPGQLSVPELGDILRKIVPGYVPGQHLPIDG